MAESGEFFKKHWTWIAGGGAGLALLWYLYGGSGTATAAAAAPGTIDPTVAAQLAMQEQAAQQQQQQQQVQDQLAQQQLTVQSQANDMAGQVAYINATTAGAASIANSYASILTAHAALPAAAIAGSDTLAGTALTSAAYTLGQGLTAAGTATAGFGTAVGQLGQGTSNVISTGLLAGAANSRSSTNMFGTLGSAAINAIGF